MTEKPQTKNGFTDPAQLPQYLKDKGRFCLWKYENRDGKRWTKVPYQPTATQYGAASTNPAHFTDLRTAMNARNGFDGIGLGIFGDVAAIDIDHCIGQGGELSVMAQTIIDAMDSYTEYSPSGTGVRIIFKAPGVTYDTNRYYINNQKASDEREAWTQEQGLEVYIAGMTQKYVTITGDVIRAADVNDRTEQIKAIVSRYMKKPERTVAAPAPVAYSVGISDRDLIETARAARNGAQFDALYRGDIDGYPSHSEADQALYNILAFYTGGDIDRMTGIFKTSGLYRPGAKPKYEDYLARTAAKAVRDCPKFYTPPRQKQEPPRQEPARSDPQPQEQKQEPTNSIDAVDAFMSKARTRDYEPIPTGLPDVDKALRGGFVRQTLVTLGAAPGAGKTILAQQIFESIATAKEDRRGQLIPSAGDVLYFNLEMSVEQLIARSLSRATGYDPLTVLRGYEWNQEQEYSVTVAAQKYKKYTAPNITYNPPDKDGNAGSPYYQDIVATMEAEAERRDSSRTLFVVIDYLQLLQDKEGKQDAAETIKSALKLFKDFAIRRNAIVFLIMAHSRATNTSGTITQGAGRDTSAIEYSGDVQLSLHYGAIADGTYKGLDDMEKAIAAHTTGADDRLYNYRALVVTKNRFGADRAKAYFQFMGEQSKFVPSERKREDPKYTPTRRL